MHVSPMCYLNQYYLNVCIHIYMYMCMYVHFIYAVERTTTSPSAKMQAAMIWLGCIGIIGAYTLYMFV